MDRIVSEAFNEEVAAFRKARFYLRCWALTPEETQALQEMLEKKGNKPMDEELFTEEAIKRLTEPEGAAPRNSEYYESMVVDIETYTNHALKLQMAVVEAEAALDDARAKLQEHLDIIRKTHVTLRRGRHE